MEYPRCHLENPASADVCDCGYSFSARSLRSDKRIEPLWDTVKNQIGEVKVFRYLVSDGVSMRQLMPDCHFPLLAPARKPGLHLAESLVYVRPNPSYLAISPGSRCGKFSCSSSSTYSAGTNLANGV